MGCCLVSTGCAQQRNWIGANDHFIVDYLYMDMATMTKRTKTWCITIGLCGVMLLCGWIAYNGGTYTKVLTTDDIRQHVDAAIAQRAEAQKAITIDTVQVVFADSLVHIDAHVLGTTHGRSVQADVHAVGVPQYQNGAFYFHPTDPIRFDNVKITDNQNFERTKQLLGAKIQQLLVQHDLEDVAQAFKADVRDWLTTRAETTFTTVLTNYPVYTLKNDYKGLAVWAVLHDVTVVDDTLHITMSVIQLGYTILISMVCLVLTIGLMIALVTDPEFVIGFWIVG